MSSNEPEGQDSSERVTQPVSREPWYARGRPEPGPGFGSSLREFPRHLNGYTIITGFTVALVIYFTFSALQVELLSAADVPRQAIVSWVAVSWFFGGVLAIILSLRYKMPIAGAWSIPGFILVGGILGAGEASLSEVFGAFWMAGFLVLLLGVTGTIKLVVRLLPLPVILAMVAGILIQFPIDMIGELESAPALVVAGILGYILFDRLGGPFRRFPGITGTIVIGGLAVVALGQLDLTGFAWGAGSVTLHTPEFSLLSFVTISIPLALMVVGAENMQATGILQSRGYDPPINSMTSLSGIGGMVAAGLGAENANVAGPTTAGMNSPDAGPVEGRYVASSISGITYMVLGAAFAGTAVSLIGALPGAFATILLGMVLVRVVVEAIQQAWAPGRFAIGAFFAFVIALSDLSFLGISAPFWSLLGGILIALVFEFEDYRKTWADYQSEKKEQATT